MNRYNAVFAVLFFYSCLSCSTQKVHKDRPISCSSFLARYAEYWQKDSIGDTGFRLLAVQSIKASCKLEGERWDVYQNFFGKANFANVSGNERYFRYRLTNYAGGNALGNKELGIIVDQFGVIKSFWVWVPG
jgi:hypothetical protein